MSVAILIQNAVSGASRLVPIATEGSYREHWLGLSVVIGLKWMPLFQTGQTVPFNALLEVVAEFESAEQWFRSVSLPAQADRAAEAARALNEVLSGSPDTTVFIG